MSQNFPLEYPNNHTQNDTIEADAGRRIQMKFTNFSLESGSGCQYDFVTIEDADQVCKALLYDR